MCSNLTNLEVRQDNVLDCCRTGSNHWVQAWFTAANYATKKVGRVGRPFAFHKIVSAPQSNTTPVRPP
jgi:hypothetical protein